MVSPADLRYTSLLAFFFALIIAAVFQYADLSSLSTWAMILGGVTTVVLRASAVRMEEREETRPVRQRRTNGLTEKQREEVRQEIERLQKGITAESQDEDAQPPGGEREGPATDETEKDERDPDTETS